MNAVIRGIGVAGFGTQTSCDERGRAVREKLIRASHSALITVLALASIVVLRVTLGF